MIEKIFFPLQNQISNFHFSLDWVNVVEIFVAYYLRSAVGYYVFVAEFVVRTKAILINKFHYRIEFLEFILERSARESHGVARINAPGSGGYDGVPVL